MNYKNHLAFYFFLSSVVVCLLCFYSSITHNILFSIVVGGIYSLLPDCDSRNSKINKYSNRILLVSLFVLLLLYIYIKDDNIIYVCMVLTLFLFFLQVVKHRGFLHSVTAMLVFTVPLLFVSLETAFFGMVGYGSHLLLDKI